MQTSLLIQYIEIPKLLMEYGPQPINKIKSFKRNLNPANLEQVIDFLTENKIITQKTTGANQSYSITKRGIGLLDFFKIKSPKSNLN